MWITSSLKAAKTPVNIALGNFDGVHLGHQRVMAEILSSAVEGQPPPARQPAIAPCLSAVSVSALHRSVRAIHHSNSDSDQDSKQPPSLHTSLSLPIGPQTEPSPGTYSTVVTFSPHPQEYFSRVSRPLLTPVAEKTWQLAQLGIHQLVMLPFNQAMAELSPEEFVEQVLIEGLQTKRISVGSDFRFGKGRCGDANGLQAIAKNHNVPVMQVPLRLEEGDRISSSKIRTALQTGDPQQAARLLGRPYTLTGRVVQGKQLGRMIGFPTANLQVPAEKYLPCTGVYSVRVYGAGGESAEPLKGVMNIGNRPTVEGRLLSVEVHLLDWAGDLYGQLLTVTLEGFVRPEQKFDSLDQLKAQIAKDCQIAITILS